MANEKVVEIFYQECEELIQSMESGLLALEADPGDMEQIHSVFRAAHTIKGNAGFVDLESVVTFAHLQENVLDKLRQGIIEANLEVISTLLESVDVLRHLIETSTSPQDTDQDRVTAMKEALSLAGDSAIGQSGVAPAKGPGQRKRYAVTMRLDPDLLLTGTDPLMILAELGDLGQITDLKADLSGLPHLEDMDPLRLYLSWSLILETAISASEIRNVFIFVEDHSNIEISEIADAETPARDVPTPASPPGPAPTAPEPVAKPVNEPAPKPVKTKTAPMPPPAPSPAPPPPAPAPKPAPAKPAPQPKPPVQRAPAATIRVDTDKLDKLVNLVGELVIGVARVSQISSIGNDSGRDLLGAVESLDHISRELQEQVMRVRMIPVESTFTRFVRVVRDLSNELHKNVKLVMSGTETELDKNVIEQITDPLKHLIRNAVDHGMETPEERTAAGKNPQGTIWLRAYQREGSIIIEVADDGHGISRQRILDKAVNRGLVSGDGSGLSDQEVFGFMFQPGFSTAQKVTEVSGRGVGLDVVKRNIESLRGTFEVDSVHGQGSTFRIKLPLTLAIIDGMTVRVGEEIFTIPLMSIIESVHPRPKDVKRVEGSGELILFRDKYIPLVRLHELFELPTDRQEPTEALVIILESRTRKFGLMVDDIEDEIQAVIKSLEKNYYHVEGTAGATILGNGHISLILDIHSLEKLAFS